MVGVSITKGSPGDVDYAVREQQRWALIGFPGIKGNYRGCSFALVIAFSIYLSDNNHRAPWLVFACCDIERVQSLHILVAMFLRHRHNIHGVRGQINDRGGSNTNRRLDIVIRILLKDIRRGDGGHIREMKKARLPQWGNHMHLISIKSIDAVVFRSNVDDVVMMTLNNDILNKERLGIHLSINRIRDPFAEVLRVDIARVEKRFVEVLSCTEGIIVKGQNGIVARHGKLLISGENKRRKSTHVLSSPSSKIQARDKQKNENDENSRSARASRVKAEMHKRSLSDTCVHTIVLV